MRHYEIIFLVHPDQSEQVPSMLERYRTMIQGHHGIVHRLENWGRRQLAYQIGKVRKAHYILMNLEGEQSLLDELENAFRFNDAVLRYLILHRDEAITGPSYFMKEEAKFKEQEQYHQSREQASVKSERKKEDEAESPVKEKSSEALEENTEKMKSTENVTDVENIENIEGIENAEKDTETEE